jgi:hypothetical protein
MRKIKAVGLCITAVLAIGCLVASATAEAALPEFLSAGKAIKPISFTIKGGAGRIVIGTTVLKWTGASGSGVLEAPNKIAKFFLKFSGDKIGTCSVKSPGAGAGEVNTKELKGTLGYIKKSTPVVGLLLEATSGGIFVEVEKSTCNTFLKGSGGTIGKDEPINSETKSFKAAFNISGEKQEFVKFEGELTEHLLQFGEKGGSNGLFECLEGLETSEPVEIRA